MSSPPVNDLGTRQDRMSWYIIATRVNHRLTLIQTQFEWARTWVPDAVHSTGNADHRGGLRADKLLIGEAH